jgi:hypothetical protein
MYHWAILYSIRTRGTISSRLTSLLSPHASPPLPPHHIFHSVKPSLPRGPNLARCLSFSALYLTSLSCCSRWRLSFH